MNEEIKQRLEIDENQLEMEWKDQALLYFHYCEKATNSVLRYDITKAELDKLEAVISMEAVSDPSKKLTVKAIENLVKINPKYENKLEELHQCKFQKDLDLSTVRALEQRKSALENLVKLYGQGYFATKSSDDVELQKNMDTLKVNSIKEKMAEINNKG